MSTDSYGNVLSVETFERALAAALEYSRKCKVNVKVIEVEK